VTVDNLFLAGILPSVLMLVPLVVYSAMKAGKGRRERTPFRLPEVWKALREALWEAPIPVLILGGIYGGFFTVTDAAAVTAFYVLVVEVFVYRDIHPFRDLPRVTVDSLTLLGSILLILMAAMSFTGYLVDREVPARLVEWIESYVETGAGFLLVLNLFLLVVGCLMDIFSATVVVVPLILPLAIKFGVHPVHLGIVFLTNLQIGFLTPPVGMGLFLASSRFEKPVLQVFRASLPFLLLLLAALLAITYVPWLSMAFVGSGRAAP
jgi:tripartite ATP-independent transporter DctM subunit